MAAAAKESQATAKVTIQCNYHCEFGQVLKVVGSNPEVGAWDLDAAPMLTWSEGDNWSLDLEVPSDSTLSFKVCLSVRHVHMQRTVPHPCR